MRQKISERIFFVTIISLLCFSNMRAQEEHDGNEKTDFKKGNVLLAKTVDTTGTIPKFGPNRLFFVTPISQLGEISGPQVYGAQTNWWSASLSYGVRTKLKLFYLNALVMDLSYRYDRFSIRQNTPKLFPLGPLNHQRERISLHNISGAFCDRINFRKRGDVMGTWLDFGVYGDWVFRSANVFVDRHYDSNSASGYSYKTKSRIVRLPYIQTMNYGFTVRVGGENGAIFACWRMSSLFNVLSPNNRDLPKLTVGIEFCPPME